MDESGMGAAPMHKSRAAPATPSVALVETPSTPVFDGSRNQAGDSNPVVLSEGDVLSSIELLLRVTSSLVRAVPNSADGAEPGQAAARHATADRAKEELRRRRQRYTLFGRAMFSEPAWDVLLILYIEHQQVRLTFSRVAEESGAPATTVHRWVDYLESQQLVRRVAHPTDKRAAYIELTDKAARALDSYFS
jgi:DNA-binding MarR family transcriptional regulator